METKITITENGPFIIEGAVIIKKTDGTEELKENKSYLCKCGYSKNKPYCDGSHRNSDTIIESNTSSKIKEKLEEIKNQIETLNTEEVLIPRTGGVTGISVFLEDVIKIINNNINQIN